MGVLGVEAVYDYNAVEEVESEIFPPLNLITTENVDE